MEVLTVGRQTILRYDEAEHATTPVDPFDMVVAWLAGLCSTGYTSDILATVHSMIDSTEIRACARLVAMCARNSIGLLEQANVGPSDVSFLPLYYAILNLSKIYVVMAGRRKDLLRNRWHGASYNPVMKPRRGLLTETIELKNGGVLPLFYEVLTGLPWTHSNRSVAMSQVYPYISGLSLEYSRATGKKAALQQMSLHVESGAAGRYALVARLRPGEHPKAGQKRLLKLLCGFRQDPNDPSVFSTKSIAASDEKQAHQSLMGSLRRYLIYGALFDASRTPALFYSPISGSSFLLPEEIPMWIAFFHLSNVVRYNPEFLAKVKDSRHWPTVLTLRKDPLLRFLLLFWSYVRQENILLSAD
jgi:hypothetical protein